MAEPGGIETTRSTRQAIARHVPARLASPESERIDGLSRLHPMRSSEPAMTDGSIRVWIAALATRSVHPWHYRTWIQFRDVTALSALRLVAFRSFRGRMSSTEAAGGDREAVHVA